MNFNGEELMLMLLYNTGSRLGLSRNCGLLRAT